MKILVTGATGYIGHQLALTLAQRGNEVHILVRNPNSHNIPIHHSIYIFKGDITNNHSIEKAIEGCEQVYHTAALVKIFDKDSSQFDKVNIEGTRNLLEKSIEHKVKGFVFTSTCSVIGPSDGEPKHEDSERIVPFECEYDITKLKAEELVKEYASKGLFTAIVSPSKVYGHNTYVEAKAISMNKMIHQFVNGKNTMIPKPGDFISNYCFVDDVVQGHILAMEKGKSGERYILGGENLSFSDFFALIKSLSGTKAKVIEVPKFLVRTLGFVQKIQFWITKKEPYITENSIKQIFCHKIFSSEKAISHLGYQVTPISDGLRKTIHHYKKQTL